MAKQKKTVKTDHPALPLPSKRLSPVGMRLLGAGGALVLLGFVVLSFADPLGKNAAAVAAPFLLIAGYAAIGVGLYRTAPPDSPA